MKAPDFIFRLDRHRRKAGLDLYPAGFDFDRVVTRQLFKKGVPLLVGTDAQTVPGIPDDSGAEDRQGRGDSRAQIPDEEIRSSGSTGT
jgi:hypothetical protein